jgi:creatine kinase
MFASATAVASIAYSREQVLVGFTVDSEESKEAKDALARIEAIKILYPDNLMAKHFSVDYYNSLTPEKKALLLKCCKSGYENPDSGMGLYAMSPTDYDDFTEYFDVVIRDYHKINGNLQHINNWDISGVEGLPKNGQLDLTALGLGRTSMRVRVGRNLKDFPLPGNMTRADRVNLEARMIAAFKKLIADPNFGGTYHTLTPNNEFSIDNAQYQQLVKDHIMFKDMSEDSYLLSAGISSDWPYGRGCYVSEDKGFIVLVGEEDHLRIMCMKKGFLLNDVFDRLNSCLKVIEGQDGCSFAHSDTYGYVTSCPTNLGSGMRASVHIALPELTKKGTDVSRAKAAAKTLGLSVRGVGGEHTQAGADGTVDISPSACLCIQEAEIVVALYKGIKLLRKEEMAEAKSA